MCWRWKRITNCTRRFPIANTRFMCWTRSCGRCQSGVPGEFVWRAEPAEGLSRAARSDSRKICRPPFSALPGARLFKTGDQVKRLPDGALSFLGGRIFRLSPGFRVDARQVEYVMSRYPGVALSIASHWVEGSVGGVLPSSRETPLIGCT